MIAVGFDPAQLASLDDGTLELVRDVYMRLAAGEPCRRVDGELVPLGDGLRTVLAAAGRTIRRCEGLPREVLLRELREIAVEVAGAVLTVREIEELEALWEL